MSHRAIMIRPAFQFILSSLITSAALVAQAPDEPKVPLAGEILALAELSSWHTDNQSSDSAQRTTGAYPVGNGHALAWLGLGARANSLTGIRGPRYANTPIGSVTLDIAIDGTPVPLPIQKIRRVRGANFVVTEDRSDSLSLRTLTFAAADDRAELMRVIVAENRGDKPLKGLVLRSQSGAKRATLAGDTESFDDGVTFAQVRLGGGLVEGRLLVARIGTLAPGSSWSSVQRISLSTAPMQAPPKRSGSAQLAAVHKEARATSIAWREALAKTTVYRSDHSKLNDLIGDWKVMIKVLQCARSGLVISSDTGTQVGLQELRGPMLAFLRFHMWDEAKIMLDTVFAAARASGSVPQTISLATDPASSPVVPTNWNGLIVPAGDSSSWTIMMHHWYWRATQDTATIRKHWPLLDRCMKGRYAQREGELELLPFGDDANWMNGGLYSQIDLSGKGKVWPDHIGNDPKAGRKAHSFVGGTLLLIATQAMGELLDGVDRAINPEKYAKGGDDIKRPGEKFTKRTFAMMAKLEQAYWQKDLGYFAPAISPVTGEPHTQAYANANLMPLWAGWTFPTGEKSRENLLNSLATKRLDHVLTQTTEKISTTTGDLNGMLLCALSERDGVGRMKVLDTLLDQAEPSGAWSRFYRKGQRHHNSDHEGLSVGESCINLDAILYAITGIRHATVPNWDNKDIRLELRLPDGSTFFTLRNSSKDGRTLNISFQSFDAVLDDAERKANNEKKPEDQRDPKISHRRMKFIVDLVDGKPAQGYYDVAANAAGTMFVRFLWDDATKMVEHNGESVQQTPRRIEESVFWEGDSNVFLPAADHEPTAATRAIPKIAGTLEFRAVPSEAKAADRAYFDTGIPFGAGDLEKALFEAEERRYETLHFDLSYDLVFPATPFAENRTNFPAWASLQKRWKRAGGKVVIAKHPLAPIPDGPVKRERVEEVLSFLASDELAGRDTPSAGQRKAAKYIALAFEKAGMQKSPGLDTWFHDYSLSGIEIDSAALSITIKADTGPVVLKPGEDVRVWRSGRPFENEDASCVIAELGKIDRRRQSNRSPTLVVVDPSSPVWREAKGKRQILSRRMGRSAPILLVRKGLLPASKTVQADIEVPAPEKVEIALQNVVAAWPGEIDEWVIVSAHYDHIGLSLSAPSDVINNGADDDGTGTSAVITLAEAIGKSGKGLRRGVLFVCFSGEEKGLKGSESFAESPPFPMEKVVADINIEMLGRPTAGKLNKAWVTGASLSNFEAISAKAFAQAGIEVIEFRMAEQLFYQSDNHSLWKKGIIAHSISAGSLHEDYHRPTDEVSKIEFAHMTAVINGLYQVIHEFASRDSRPKLTEKGQRMMQRSARRRR